MPDRGRTLVLISDLGTGGTARATTLVVNGLVERECEVSLLVMQRGGVHEGMLDKRVRLFSLDAPAKRGVLTLLALPKLVRVLKQEKASRIVSAGNHMHLLATLAHRLGSCAGDLILKMTNPVERGEKSSLNNALRRSCYRWAFRCAARVLTITDAARRELAAMYPDTRQKLTTVANPYVTDAMLATGSSSARFDQGRLLAIGRLAPQKNYPLMLSALARIKATPWTLEILGDGPLQAELGQLAGELGISDRVHFRGFVSDPLPYLGKAHALLLSSAWEGQGAVLLEALACGCPVVATRSTEAVVETLDAGRLGRLVPPDDPGAFAAAVAGELDHRSKLPDVRQWLKRYSLEAGVLSHAEALGLV